MSQSLPQSAYYHGRKTTPANEAKKYTPKLIEAKASQPALSRQGSAWNKGGTWEERDCSDWARSALKTHLMSATLPSMSDGKLQISSASLSGDASIVWSRGNKSIGYHLNVTIDFKGEVNSKAVSGQLKIPELEDDEGDDYEVTVSVSKSDAAHSQARQCVQGDGVAAIRGAISAFLTEFRAYDC